jgi:hypothetical protein
LSVQISYKKQTLFAIIVIVLILFSIEGISRVMLYPTSCEVIMNESKVYSEFDNISIQEMCRDYKTTVANRHTPITYLEPNSNSKTISVNNFGFRGNDITMEKNENVFRIFVVGGSTVYGSNASSDETTITGYLQQFLQKSNNEQKFEVINAGVPGDWSFQENQKIKGMLIKFEPDLIIIYDGWNELNFNNEEFEEDQISYYLSYLPQKFQYYYHTPEFISKMINFLEKQQEKQQETDLDNLSEKKVSRWYQRHSEICELSKNENFMTIIILQPHLDLGGKPLSEFENKILKNYPQKIAKVAYPYFQNSLHELDKQCTKTDDFSDIFDNVDKPIFFDNGHIGDLGNEIVAKRMHQLVFEVMSNQN